jgi:peptide/nickel transport system permease protein
LPGCNYFQRVNASIDGLLSSEGAIIAARNAETGELEEKSVVKQTDFANVNEVANVRLLPLGTDNFGRDADASWSPLRASRCMIGLVAGLIATTDWSDPGLDLAGYIGGIVDDVIMFVTNLFTVIPTFVLADLDLLQH